MLLRHLKSAVSCNEVIFRSMQQRWSDATMVSVQKLILTPLLVLKSSLLIAFVEYSIQNADCILNFGIFKYKAEREKPY